MVEPTIEPGLQSDSIKDSLRTLINKAGGEVLGGVKPRVLAENSIEEELGRVSLVRSIKEAEQLMERHGCNLSIQDKFALRLTMLGSGGFVGRFDDKDGARQRFIILGSQNDQVLKHELQHVADRIVFGDEEVERNVGKSAIVSRAALVGTLIWTIGGVGLQYSTESASAELLGGAAIVFGLITLIGMADNKRREVEVRARKAEK